MKYLFPQNGRIRGYRDYDGYAWYRKSIVWTGNADEKMVIMMGKIDDIDQVFINGIFVGSTGNFPEKGREPAKYRSGV